MTTMLAERKALIKQLACDAFEIDDDELTEDSQFDADLGIDSLSMIDLLAALEKNFGVEIDRADLARMVDLAGVYEVVAASLGWSGDEPGDGPASR